MRRRIKFKDLLKASVFLNVGLVFMAMPVGAEEWAQGKSEGSYVMGTDVVVSDSTTLTGDLILQAPCEGCDVSISGDGKTGLFFVRYDGIASLRGEGIVFKDGYVGGEKGGGAIGNAGTITYISGIFKNNKFSKEEAVGAVKGGGAIYNHIRKIIEKIENSKFTGNISSEVGGAIYNIGIINYISAAFENNEAQEFWDDGGGAIFNGENATIEKIENSTFIGNTSSGEGGAISNLGTIGNIVNSSFIENKTECYAGAIYSENSLTITADNGNSLFSGNYYDEWGGKQSDAIYMEKGTLTLNAYNGGEVRFDDAINGGKYDITITTDAPTSEEMVTLAAGEGEAGAAKKDSIVILNNEVKKVNNFTVSEGSFFRLGKDAIINAVNYIADNAVMTLDIAVNAIDQTVKSGLLKISGDVEGDTVVIVNAENPDTFEGAEVKFVEALEDNHSTEASFEVARVNGSPYLWETKEDKGADKGTNWSLFLTDKENPNYGTNKPDEGDDNRGDDNKPTNPVYAPEVANYAGIQSAAVEQNRSISQSVARGLKGEKSAGCYEESCSAGEFVAKKRAWIDVVSENSELSSPVDMDAEINGVTLGLDIANNGTHRAGLFGSYRYGKYDVSGKGKYYSYLGSDIKNDSYLGGLYYAYSHNDWSMLGMAYAGKQDMDIKTDDKIVSASTDAKQYGVSLSASKEIKLSDRFGVRPEAGVRYSLIDIDSLSDNVGKSAKFDTLHYLEAEVGARFEYLFCRGEETNRVYVKPSVIQTVAEGGKTSITGVRGDVKSLKDQTLGRMELGGEFEINNKWFGYANTGYTYGNDYSAYDFNLGLGYSF